MTAVAQRNEVTTTERFESIALAAIVASNTNPRTHFDEGYIQELSRSIADKGLIQPIVVRPLDVMQAVLSHPEAAASNGAKYEIVAGECRFRASKLALLNTIPAIVRDYTDEQVLEVQLIENIHRTDLTPLERARGYRRLIDTNPTKHSAENIAARIGMSPAWVWDTMKLLDLVPEAQQLLEDERISAGHAILIARLKPEHQALVIHPEDGGLFEHEGGFEFNDDLADKDPYHGMKPRSIRELADWISHHVRFDVQQAAQAAPLTFEPVAERVEAATATPGRGKKVIAITYDHHVRPEAKAEERTYSPSSWKRADGTKVEDEWGGKMLESPTCEFSVLGVVAVGPHYGEAFEVCIARDKCRTHWKQEIATREKNQKLRDSGQADAVAKREAAAATREQREREERARLEERWKTFKPALTKAVYASASKVPATLPKPVYQKVLSTHHLPPGTTPAQLQKALLMDAIRIVFDRYSWHNDEPHMVAWAKLLGVDVKACEPKALQTSGAKAKAPAKRGRR